MKQIPDIALLIIDFPDERLGARRRFDHMHAWGTQDEMRSLKRRLEDHLGDNDRHVIVNGYVCPQCGVIPPRIRRSPDHSLSVNRGAVGGSSSTSPSPGL